MEALSQLSRICQGKVSWEQIDQEIRSRKLVVVAGGGGGVGYIYLGAFKFLADAGFTPSLIVGTSIGAILGLCRAKHLDFDSSSFVRVLRSLSWGKLFQLLSTKSRYGLPAALRFHLHSAIGSFFRRPDGTPLCLSDLPIPLVVTVSGIRSGVLPHPIEFYETLLEGIAGFPRPWFWARKIPQIISSFTELAQISDRLQTINLGLDSGTESFDAVDAVGFSAALPGVLHYDLIRRDERMRAILDDMFLRHDLFRITDGFLVDNVPVRAAWQAVQRGLIGTRNAMILALDGFAPRLSSPMWLAIQQLMATQVQKGIGHAHLYKGFSGTLSPLEAIPSVSSMVKMMERGKAELMSELPFLNRMLQPLGPLKP
jgi:predicted acylesterase/phospholipase RssA